MEDKKTELSVSTEVLEKMAEIAAKEVDGVTGLSKKAIDLKGIVKTKNAFKGVKVENINGAIEISVYICVKQDAKVKDVAEKVILIQWPHIIKPRETWKFVFSRWYLCQWIQDSIGFRHPNLFHFPFFRKIHSQCVRLHVI